MLTHLFKLLVGKFADGTVRRFLFFAAVAFWLGGFSFYGGVVIEVGSRVLGSHLKQGFITQAGHRLAEHRRSGCTSRNVMEHRRDLARIRSSGSDRLTCHMACDDAGGRGVVCPSSD